MNKDEKYYKCGDCGVIQFLRKSRYTRCLKCSGELHEVSEPIELSKVIKFRKKRDKK